MTKIGTVELIATIDTKQYTSGADTIESTNKKLNTSVENVDKRSKGSFKSFASNASSSFNSVASSIAALAKASAALIVGGAFGVGAFVKQASELQGIRASFEAMTGSAGEATKVLKQLNKFSFETAFSSADINAAARAFLSSGVAVKDLGKLMQQAGDIAGATGADLGRLILPLSQSISNGKLDLENFYQIADSGAGKLGQVIREKLAKQGFGSLTEANEAGLDTLKLLLDTMKEVTKQGGFAFQGAIKQSKTFDGQMSNLQETIGNVGLEVLGVNKATGEIDPKGVFARLSKAVQDATKWLNDNKEAIKDVANFMIENFIPIISSIAAAFIAAKVAAVGFAIATSPVSAAFLILAGIVAAVVAAVTFLQVKFQFFTKLFDQIVKKAQPFIDIFRIHILPVLKEIAAFVGGVFKTAFDEISKAFQQLMTALEPIMPQLKILAKFVIVGLLIPLISLIAVITAVTAAIVGIVTAWAFVVGKVSSFIGYLIKSTTGFRDKLVALFKNVGATIGNAIANTVKTAVNFILKRAVGLINGFIDAINGVVGTINKIPGVKVNKVSRLPIPQLATGGIVEPRRGGVLANIAEGGEAEAVIPLSKLDSMLNKQSPVQSGPQAIVKIPEQSSNDYRQGAINTINAYNDYLRSKGLPQIGIA